MHDELQQLNARIEQRHWWFVARRQILTRLVRRLLPPGQGKTVLDIGCGTGSTLAALKHDYRCVGVDTSAEAVRLGGLRHPEVRFFAIPDWAHAVDIFGQADLVLLNDVLEHIEHEAACFGQLVESVRAGTLFLITVPADPALWSSHDVVHGHFRRYTWDTFRALWGDLPVEEILLSALNRRLYPIAKLVRMFSRLRGRAAGPANTDLVTPAGPINWVLQKIFAGEATRILAALEGHGSCSRRRSVSLLAVLRRKAVPAADDPPGQCTASGEVNREK
ncbi:MAG: class I SAM-dependent methyltransferase [Pirellulales bacterium]|nr:class I SAM-dependent methyltransferase [Pirellulales bacterium]